MIEGIIVFLIVAAVLFFTSRTIGRSFSGHSKHTCSCGTGACEFEKECQGDKKEESS
jgi:hypothetical protein